MNSPTNSDEIIALLLGYGTPIESWGKDGARSIDQLIEEALAGYVRLEVRDGRLVRKITCVGIRIKFKCWSPNLKLVEVCQIHKKRAHKRARKNFDGLSLIRRFDPEKTGARAEAGRMIGERLGIAAPSYDLEEDDPPTISKPSAPSLLYPGLIDENLFHVFLWSMPKEFFKVEGYVENQPTHRTRFAWEND